jgi:S1-C subfamily serine protease
VVTAIEGKSPADEAGLLTGDIIVSVDNSRVTGADDLVRLLDAERIDRVVAVDVLRRSDMRRFWVGLKERVA